MVVKLGPIPLDLRRIVARWIEQGLHTDPPPTEAAINALFISGGPAYLSYLDANGEIWNYCGKPEGFVKLDDGPQKVAEVIVAATRLPELVRWLPRPSIGATECTLCIGTGWLRPPSPHCVCTECSGLGWRPPTEVGETVDVPE